VPQEEHATPTLNTRESVAAALEAMLVTLRRYVAFHDDHQAHALALFAASSYAVAELDTCPYVLIGAPEPECGKTTCASVLGRFMYGHPDPLSKATPAGIRRELSRIPDASLVLDEIDRVDARSEYGLELFATINGGYNRRSSGSIRADVKSRDGIVTESTFGFKVLVGIESGKLPETTRSRCIPCLLQRALPGETQDVWEPTRLQTLHLDREADEFSLTMSQVRWAWLPQAECKDDELSLLPESIDNGGFPNRSKQLWRPLLSVAEFAGPEWLGRALDAAKALGVDHKAASPTILLDIHETTFTDEDSVSKAMRLSVFSTSDGDAIPSDDLRRVLVNMFDSRWRKSERFSELSGKRLSQLLAPFGIRPKLRAVKDDSKSAHRSYLIAELRDLMARYGLAETPIQGASVRSVRTQSQHGLTPDVEVLDAHESNTSPAAGNVDVAQVLTVLTDELGIDASPKVGWVPPDEDVVVF
jgi:putative DNA primase/helicase